MDDLLQATDDKNLIIEDQFEGQADAAFLQLHYIRRYDFWTSRYLCSQDIHDDEFWRFDIFDFLTNDSKSVRFQKSSDQFEYVETYFLSYEFVLVFEMTNLVGGLCRINLVKLGWESGVFEKLKHFERRADIVNISVDLLNQSKFVLSCYDWPAQIGEYQECELINGKIEFGNTHLVSDDYFYYSSDKLIGIHNLDRKIRVKTYNMIEKQEKSFETETIPDRVELVNNSLRKWILDHLYVAIRFRDSGNYGLMWADAKTRQWNILDFSANIMIKELHFFDDSLIIYTKQAGKENGVFKSNVKFYGISIGRPQSLRQKAWLRVIRNLKLEGHSNPYKEAVRYLPLNTDLRPHWFEDVEEEASDKQGSKKDTNEKSNPTGTNGESKAIQEAKSDQGENNDGEEAPKKQGNDGEE